MKRQNLLIIILLNFTSAAAYAESVFELLHGTLNTDSATVDASSTSIFTSLKSSRNITFKKFQYLALQTKYWSEFDSETGFGAGFYWLNFKDSGSVDIRMLMLSADFLYRKQLNTNDRYPYGKLQPFIGAGMNIYHASTDIDFSPTLKISPGDYGFGFELLAGVRWLFSERYAISLEYKRFLINLNISNSFITSQSVSASLNSSYILAGLSWEF